MAGVDMFYQIESKWGTIIYQTEEENLLGVWFEHQKYFPKITEKIQNGQEDHEFVKALRAYEKHDTETFNLKFQLRGTPFQQMVWDILMTIPYGETRSYKWVADLVAKQMHKPSMSAQAVGQAVGRNPFSIVIPCHRVLSTSGQLTGYAGGVDRKEKLLQHEKSDF